MRMEELDRPEYAEIPIYPLGDGESSPIPFSCLRYNDHCALSPLHRHSVVQINYIARGKLLHRINDNQFDLVRGNIFVIPPYIPHQLLPSPGQVFELVEVEFEPAFVLGQEPNHFQELETGYSFLDFSYIEPFLVSECDVRPRLSLTGETQTQVERLLAELEEEYTKKQDGYLLSIKADLLKLLVILGRVFHETIKDKPEMQLFNHHRDAMLQTLKYINDNLTEPLTIESVSRHALLSQSYFSYLFKVLTGQTFVEYLHNERIKRAMELLAATEDRVLNICYACGFNNINHFNRIFKSIVGISPTQFRSSNRQNSSISSPQ